MRKTLSRVLCAQAGWPRLAFGGIVVGLGAVSLGVLELVPGPAANAQAGATALVIAGMAVRAWIGPVQDDDPDEDLIY